jgi:hypothetical protein
MFACAALSWGLAQVVTQDVGWGRVIAILPWILAMIPYVFWAFGVRCPRCGYNFMYARGDFWYYTWTSEMVECPKCNLDIDEPMDNRSG